MVLVPVLLGPSLTSSFVGLPFGQSQAARTMRDIREWSSDLFDFFPWASSTLFRMSLVVDTPGLGTKKSPQPSPKKKGEPKTMKLNIKTKNTLRSFTASLLLLAAGTITVHAQYAYFNDPTDTIRVNGNTTFGSAATYEALIQFPAAAANGVVFNEWDNSFEDKGFFAGTSTLSGIAYPAGSLIVSSLTLGLNQWHHIAYVYDGSEQRIYLDGNLVGLTTGSGSISNSNSGAPFVGALIRGSLIPSFQGYMDTLRISDIARYSGASFTAPTGDFATDANTQLLYNFNEASGSPTAVDSSGFGRDGTLGAGFAGATSPEFISSVPEPAGAVLLLGSGAMFLVRRRRAAV